MELEQQFLELVGIVERLQNRIDQLEKQSQALIRAQKQMVDWIEQEHQDNYHFQENVEYEVSAAVQSPVSIFFPKIQSGEAAIKEIRDYGKSMARFGDGEFAAIAGRVRHRFQNQADGQLGERLREVIQSDRDDLLIGIADNYGSLRNYTQQTKREIRCYLNAQIRKEHMELLDSEKIYYDAYMTRPYVIYADNQTDAPKKRFQLLQTIWEKRRCIFVEGCFTKLGVGNDLFANAAEIGRILGPAENAFSRYDKILECCLQQPKDRLFLLALGPAATVLAYDLCRAGYQAVDIGHIDLEYEWFLRGEGKRCHIDGKYNNELQEEQQLELSADKSYKEQMIADFSR